MRFTAADFRASVVVFLVALPLCLGIALASGAPLSSGIIAGILGGTVLGLLGGSEVSVSGPAAGLTTIVAAAIADLGGFAPFTAAVALAGVMQLALGLLKAGELGNFFPTAVIKGMLAAIGLILILKQLPHAVGWDADYMGDESFGDIDGENTLSGLLHGWQRLHWGATLVSTTALGLMLFWDKFLVKRLPKVALVPSALVAVVVGVLLNETLFAGSEALRIDNDHLVRLPFAGGIGSFLAGFSAPQWEAMANPKVWKVALTLAIVASLETLLSLDAADKIDPLKRLSRKNKELRGQGVANLISGLLGGLPMTAVIVRTSANVAGGGLHRSSAFMHGVWLLAAVIFFPHVLNRIPLSALAAVLLLVGWKLASPKLFVQEWRRGRSQFVPFTTTVVAILLTDLLTGIGIGLMVGLFFVLRANAKAALMVIRQDGEVLLRFHKDISFLQKARIRAILRDLPDGTSVVLDGSRSISIDHDIVELVEDFLESAPGRRITVRLQKSPLALCALFKE